MICNAIEEHDSEQRPQALTETCGQSEGAWEPMPMKEFMRYASTIQRQPWKVEWSRLPCFKGRIVAASENCFIETGWRNDSKEQRLFRLSELKHVIQQLGHGRHDIHTVVLPALQSKIGGVPTPPLIIEALDQLERKGWLQLHSDDTVELT